MANTCLVNVIVVLGSERLYSDMARRYNGQRNANNEPVSVIKVEKSGGCVDRDSKYLHQLRRAQIREYFFGTPRNTLSPHMQQLDFNQVQVFKLAEGTDTMDLLQMIAG